MSREAALIDVTLRLLRLHRVFCWRNNSGATRYGRPGQRVRFVRYGLVGSADILGVCPGGRFLALECKTGNVPVTRMQQAFLDSVRMAGGLAAVVRSSDEVLALVATLPQEARG